MAASAVDLWKTYGRGDASVSALQVISVDIRTSTDYCENYGHDLLTSAVVEEGITALGAMAQSVAWQLPDGPQADIDRAAERTVEALGQPTGIVLITD